MSGPDEAFFSGAVRPRFAATVVLIRDTPGGMDVLLLKRNAALAVAAGCWVFPGGAIDGPDLARASGDIISASRHAAIREAREEAGLTPALEQLLPLGHWIGPAGDPRRFATWYYIAPCPAPDALCVDGGEIVDGRWLRVEHALALHRAGRLPLFPPTFLTLCQLRSYHSAAQALRTVAVLTPTSVMPVFATRDSRRVALLAGDADYPDHRGAAGARHCIWQQQGCWHYVCDDVPPGIRPLDGRDIAALIVRTEASRP